jgi:DNA-binding XRE family transcriptional regulator
MKYNRLKECLVEKEISQKWLSEKLSVSKVTVNMWCKNKSQPPLKKMFEISKLIGVDTKELIQSNIEV